MDETVLGLLYKQLDEEKVAVQEALISGAAQDYATYTNMCGQMRGIAVAQSLVNNMVERLRKQQDL